MRSEEISKLRKNDIVFSRFCGSDLAARRKDAGIATSYVVIKKRRRFHFAGYGCLVPHWSLHWETPSKATPGIPQPHTPPHPVCHATHSSSACLVASCEVPYRGDHILCRRVSDGCVGPHNNFLARAYVEPGTKSTWTIIRRACFAFGRLDRLAADPSAFLLVRLVTRRDGTCKCLWVFAVQAVGSGRRP